MSDIKSSMQMKLQRAFDISPLAETFDTLFDTIKQQSIEIEIMKLKLSEVDNLKENIKELTKCLKVLEYNIQGHDSKPVDSLLPVVKKSMLSGKVSTESNVQYNHVSIDLSDGQTNTNTNANAVTYKSLLHFDINNIPKIKRQTNGDTKMMNCISYERRRNCLYRLKLFARAIRAQGSSNLIVNKHHPDSSIIHRLDSITNNGYLYEQRIDQLGEGLNKFTSYMQSAFPHSFFVHMKKMQAFIDGVDKRGGLHVLFHGNSSEVNGMKPELGVAHEEAKHHKQQNKHKRREDKAKVVLNTLDEIEEESERETAVSPIPEESATAKEEPPSENSQVEEIPYSASESKSEDYNEEEEEAEDDDFPFLSDLPVFNSGLSTLHNSIDLSSRPSGGVRSPRPSNDYGNTTHVPVKVITQIVPEDKSIVRLDSEDRFPETLCEQIRQYIILHPLPAAVHSILDDYEEAYVPEPHNYHKTNDYKPYLDTEHPTPAAPLSRDNSLMITEAHPTAVTSTGMATRTDSTVDPDASRVMTPPEIVVSPSPPAAAHVPEVPAHVSPVTVSHAPVPHAVHASVAHVVPVVHAPVLAPAPAPEVHHHVTKHHDPPVVHNNTVNNNTTSHEVTNNTNNMKYNAPQTNYKPAHAAHDDKGIDKRLVELNKALDNKIGRGDFDQLKSMVQELMYTSMTREEADAMLEGVFRPDDILSPVGGGKGTHRNNSMIAVDPRSAKLRSCIEQVSRSIITQESGHLAMNSNVLLHDNKSNKHEANEEFLKEIHDEVDDKLFNERRKHEKENEKLIQEINGLKKELESLDILFQNKIMNEKNIMETFKPELAKLTQMVTVISEEHKAAAVTVII